MNIKFPHFFSYKDIVYTSILVLVLVPLTLNQVMGNDIWKALYSGRYLSIFSQFPHHSTFTFSPVKDLVPKDTYNWLGNLVILGFFRVGGIPALIAFRFFLAAFAIFIPLSLADYKWHPLILIFSIAYLFGIKQKLIVRTAWFAVPGMVLLTWIIVRSSLNKSSKLLWYLPILFLFWGNMHGSYIAGVGFVGLFTIGSVLDWLFFGLENALLNPTKLGLVLLTVITVGTLVKPFPDYQLISRFESLGGRLLNIDDYFQLGFGSNHSINKDSNSFNESKNFTNAKNLNKLEKTNATNRKSRESTETFLDKTKGFFKKIIFPDKPWRSAEYSSPFKSYSFLFVSITFILIPIGLSLFLIDNNNFYFVQFLPVVGALFLGLGYLRTVGYFSLLIFPVGLWKYRLGHFDNIVVSDITYIVSLAAAIILSGSLMYYTVTGNLDRFFGSGKHELKFGKAFRFSEQVPKFILRKYPDKKFFNDYNISGYLIWKFWPYQKVFFDSKGTAYQLDFFAKFGSKNPIKLSRKYNLSMMVFSVADPFVLYKMIPNKSWRVMAFDEGMVVLQKDPGKIPNPFDALLLNANAFNKLPERRKISLKNFINFLYESRTPGDKEGEKNN